MPTGVIATASPIGGVASFLIGGYATGAGAQMTVSRAVSGGAYATIYSGSPAVFYIDAGDAGLSGSAPQPTPLSSGSNYFWQFSDPSGTVTVGPIQPIPTLIYEGDKFTELIIRCLQAGVNNATLPGKIQRATVMHDLPLGGFPALPFVSVTMQSEEQEETGIGQTGINPISNENYAWSIPTLARRCWRVSVYGREVITRDFYRRLVTDILVGMLPDIFTGLGQNVTHRFISSTGQEVEDKKGQVPAFYFADILFELTGLFNVSVALNYPSVIGVLVGIGVSGVTVSGLAPAPNAPTYIPPGNPYSGLP